MDASRGNRFILNGVRKRPLHLGASSCKLLPAKRDAFFREATPAEGAGGQARRGSSGGGGACAPPGGRCPAVQPRPLPAPGTLPRSPRWAPTPHQGYTPRPAAPGPTRLCSKWDISDLHRGLSHCTCPSTFSRGRQPSCPCCAGRSRLRPFVSSS